MAKEPTLATERRKFVKYMAEILAKYDIHPDKCIYPASSPVMADIEFVFGKTWPRALGRTTAVLVRAGYFTVSCMWLDDDLNRHYKWTPRKTANIQITVRALDCLNANANYEVDAYNSYWDVRGTGQMKKYLRHFRSIVDNFRKACDMLKESTDGED